MSAPRRGEVRANWAHEDRKAEAEWQRAQTETERQEEAQRRRDEIEANIRLLEMFADRGHLDTHYENIGDLIRRIRGEVGASPGGTAGGQAALTQGGEPESGDPKDDNDN